MRFRAKDKKWGLYDVARGEVALEAAFAQIFENRGEFWILKRSAKGWGAADATGRVVIEPKVPWLGPIFEDRGATRNKQGRVGFVDAQGTLVIEHSFESRGSLDDMHQFHDGRCGAQVNGRVGFIDRAGEWVIPARFVNGFFFGEGRGSVVDEGGSNYVDEQGEFITTERFDRADTFARGVGVVARAAGVGAVNRDGELIVPPVCRSVGFAGERLAVRAEGGHMAYYRADGSCVWKHADFPLELNPRFA